MTVTSAVPAVGDRHVSEVGPITRTDLVRYQGASGEMHPLHHDEPHALAHGFPSVFSLGMYQGGLLATALTGWLGAEGVRRYSMRFLEQCWPGDVLRCEGEVTAVGPGAEGGVRVVVALRCTRPGGGVAVLAEAEVELAAAVVAAGARQA